MSGAPPTAPWPRRPRQSRGALAAALALLAAVALLATVALLAALALPPMRPAAAAGPIDWAKAETVTVVAVEYRFEPERLVFRRGVPYRLRVIDRGSELHELTAPKFFAAIAMRNPAVLNPERREIVVRPGEERDLYFVAPRRGRFAMWCADHDWAGMTGQIIVR